MLLDIIFMETKKFTFSGMFANSANGIPSNGKVIGTFLVLFGCTCFGYGVFFCKQLDILSLILIQSLAIITLGSSLISFKIFKPTKKIEDNDVN